MAQRASGDLVKAIMSVFIVVAAMTTSAQADTFSLTGRKAQTIFVALGGATTATNGRIDLEPGAPGNSLVNQRKNLRCSWSSSSASCESTITLKAYTNSPQLMTYESYAEELFKVLKSIGVSFIERDGYGSLNLDAISCVEQFVKDPQQSPVYSCDIQQTEHGV